MATHLMTAIPTLGKIEVRGTSVVQGHPGLHSEFQVSLDYRMRPSFKINNFFISSFLQETSDLHRDWMPHPLQVSNHWHRLQEPLIVPMCAPAAEEERRQKKGLCHWKLYQDGVERCMSRDRVKPFIMVHACNPSSGSVDTGRSLQMTSLPTYAN